MKSSEHTTGLSAEEHKVTRILQELSTYYDDHKLPNTDEDLANSNLTVKIVRFELEVSFTRAFDKPVDSRTSSKFIKYLLGQDILIEEIAPNLQKKKRKKSDGNTAYFINPITLEAKLRYLKHKYDKFQLEKNAIHTPKFNLMTFMNQQSVAHKDNLKISEPISSYRMN